jgi:hypothetical protein
VWTAIGVGTTPVCVCPSGELAKLYEGGERIGNKSTYTRQVASAPSEKRFTVNVKEIYSSCAATSSGLLCCDSGKRFSAAKLPKVRGFKGISGPDRRKEGEFL